MHKLLFIFFVTFVCIGCNNTSSKEDTNKDSIIKLQEERINQLQQQLNNPTVTTVDTNSTAPKKNKQIDLSSSLDYFTIGSTEDEVLTVQGQPTSIEKIVDSKIFFYGGSSVTFNKGIVESYRDDGNLKIKVGTNSKKIKTSDNNDNDLSSNNNFEGSTIEKNDKKESKEVKYIYFTFMTTDVQIDIDPITNKLKNKEDDYSEIYSISGYTYQKQQALEFCLTKNYKEWTGKQVFLTAHSYDDRQLALMNWNNEKGSLYNHAMCSELMQIGIIAQ